MHHLEYHQLIAHKGQINLKIIQLLLKSLVEKQDALKQTRAATKMKEYAKAEFKIASELNIEDFIEKKAYFSGTEKFSSLWYQIPIEIIKINESEITFYSDEIIEEGTLLKLDLPIEFFVTIVHNTEMDEQSNKKKYLAIIHSITYKKLQLLRQYINKLIELKKEHGSYISPNLINDLRVKIKVKNK